MPSGATGALEGDAGGYKPPGEIAMTTRRMVSGGMCVCLIAAVTKGGMAQVFFQAAATFHQVVPVRIGLGSALLDTAARLGEVLFESESQCVREVSHGLAQKTRARFSALGSGIMRIDEEGHIVIAVALEVMIQRDNNLISHRVFKFIPHEAKDTSDLPTELTARFELTYDVEKRTARIAANRQTLFHFALSKSETQEDAGVYVDEEGALFISGGIQISVCDFNPEAVEIQAVPESQAGDYGNRPHTGLTNTEGLINQFAEANMSGGSLCSDCNAGGPGSTGCSVDGCKTHPTDCSTQCGSGYYSCCKCKSFGGGWSASCACCKIGDPKD